MTGPDAPIADRLGLHRIGLRGQVFAGMVVVLLIETAVLALVAWIEGPSQFTQHLGRTGVTDPLVLDHAEQAYSAALLLSLAVGLSVAVICGLAAAWLLARRISRPLARLTGTAQAVSAGDYSARVAEIGPGPDFEEVEAAFNDMAARLEGTEQARARLIGDVAHELRTPLAHLTALLEALDDGVVQPGPATWSLMTDQVLRLRRVAEDVTQAIRGEQWFDQLQCAETSLRTLVTSAAEAIRAQAQSRDITVAVDTPTHELMAAIDRDRIDQAVTALLTNALKHAQGATTIDLVLRSQPGWATITVADDGPGIAPADRPYVFDRFYRGDLSRHTPGTGLGLPIARAIAQAHGGRLELVDTAHPGATFRLTLPLSPPVAG